MEVRRHRVSSSVRTEGGLLPPDLLAKIAAADKGVPGLADADFGLPTGDRLREAITRSWNRLVGAWAALTAVRVGAEPSDPLTSPTRERWLQPLFDELGFGRLATARAVEIDGTSYPISHAWGSAVPVHLVGFGIELDRRTPGVRGAAGAAPHALVQEYLNRSDAALWGVVSNGRSLRLLRDSTSLTRQAFVEFDLEAIFEGELYADFALLWSVCHRTRFEAPKPEECLLERWTKIAADEGTRALEQLRGGVETAIETLGAGFLAHPANSALREALRSGELDRQDYYRELLRLVYRLIFLFTAEDRRDETTGRELLLDPGAPDAAAERYRRFYSTARLRSIAGRKRGTRHPDLWVSLRRVIGALGGDGAPTLALPALGSFLFGTAACPHLDAADLRNEELLDAVRALTTVEEDRRLRLVDYRNLGAEELGGIYEGLLELHPRIEVDATPPRFSLGTAVGNERKSSGSYYTPTSLITCLLDSALDPVVDEAVKGKTAEAAERAILDLAVVDPAAGSGHFLVAASHRLAKRLGAIRTGEGEPPPAAVRHALRDVIAHCIYAVDLNPMAVELCKVSLWLEALEPGRPLSFLDAHIKCGNSLLGTTPELVAAGIPDAAYEAITGDDKAVARAWRDRNRKERDGQQALFEGGLEIPLDALAREVRSLDGLPDETPETLAAKAARHAGYVASVDYRRARATLDAWCAAFVAPKTLGSPEITTATVRGIGTSSAAAPPAVRGLVATIAASFAFFHWPIEFPAVFHRGGFDVVLGNPPWEQVKLKEKEFFAERNPAIAEAKSAADRKRLIANLKSSDVELWNAFRHALHRAEAESQVLRTSGRYPLAGRGDINTYAVFCELMTSITAAKGRAGAIVPTGIATYDTTRLLFGSWVDGARLVSLYDFENTRRMFADVHPQMRFSLLTVAGSRRENPTDLVALAREVRDLAEMERHFSLEPAEFALINPNTRTAPTFRSFADAELAKAIYRRVPVLVRTAEPRHDPWSMSFMQMFSMTEDSPRFHDSPRPGDVPLYEAKYIHQFDHRWRPAGADGDALEAPAVAHGPDRPVSTRYWVDALSVEARLAGRWSRGWLLAWRNITNTTNERTVISSIVPRVGVGNSLYLALSTQRAAPFLAANLNSFVLDWVARQALGGTNLNLFIVQQLPVLPPSAYEEAVPWDDITLGEWIRPRFVELVFTSRDLRPLAEDLGYDGPPFPWSETRRRTMRAELDAAFLHAYGLDRKSAEMVVGAFPLLARRDHDQLGNRATADLVLDAYDAMAAATPAQPFVTPLDPPPGDPRVAHPPRPGEEAGHWLLWSDVAGRAQLESLQRPSGRSRPVAPALAPSPTRPSARPQPPATKPARLTLGFGSLSTVDGRWLPETAVEPAAVVLGTRVRHRAFGPGTVLSTQPSGGSTQLLIRFDAAGEKWIAFGYGLLEFEE